MRYIGGHVSIAGGLDNSIKNTLDIGGNCLQIFAGSPRLWFRKPFPDQEVARFLDSQKKNDLGPVFIHALYLVNLASTNKELLEKSISSLVMDLKNGAKINAAGVIIHIGSHQGNGFESVKNQLVDAFQKILAETENCDLILENAAGQNGKIGSLEELSYLVDKLDDPRMRICLDTAHLFAGGVDLRKVEIVDKLIKDLGSFNLLKRLACIHLNDCASDLGSHRDVHANLGEGKIGLEGLKNFITREETKHPPLLLEVPGVNKQGPDLQNITTARGLVT